MKLVYDRKGITLQLDGMERMWAFKASFRIPYDCVEDVQAANDSGLSAIPGIRLPGTHIPGVIVAGTYFNMKEKLFLYVVKSRPVLKISLKGHSYDKVILSIDSPFIEAATILEYLVENENKSA